MYNARTESTIRPVKFSALQLKTSVNRVHGRCVSVKGFNVNINVNVNVKDNTNFDVF